MTARGAGRLGVLGAVSKIAWPVGEPYNAPVHLFLPLISALLYVGGALFLKQATLHGVGVWRTTFVANLICAVLFAGLWPLGGELQPASTWWQPAVVAFLFLAGQALSFLAIEHGDVSVATPVMGVKVLMVAAFSTVVIGEAVPLTLWLAAASASAGIAFLNRRPDQAAKGRVGLTIMLAMTAAAAYAMFDVLVQKWSPAWGAGRFLPVMLAFVAVYSLGLIPFFHSPLRAIAPAAWRPLLCGAILIAAQGLILITTLSLFGDATAVNVVYGSRGFWSVLAVWWLGHWFANTEGTAGGRVLGSRLTGAVLLTGAIVLLFL
ncbi:MAG TPA: hypothetical protein DCY13_06480 [Verrucomicrobiales bacterium]|nr:hypothetical protein [Verrucomicrobiales bacterium]